MLDLGNPGQRSHVPSLLKTIDSMKGLGGNDPVRKVPSLILTSASSPA